MPVFKLKRDEKYETWWRDFFEVEADTIEEAINLIKEGEIDPYDSEILPHFSQDPLEREIYNEDGDMIYYDSK